MKNLKVVLDAPKNYDLVNEEAFVYFYGWSKCRKLQFKDFAEIIKIMEEYDPNSLNTQQLDFIKENENKAVLCYICHMWEDNPDIFVFGDDNIAFRKECFV